MHDMHMDHSDMPAAASANVAEFHLAWPGSEVPGRPGPPCHPAAAGSTHEIVWDRDHGGKVFWVSGQAYDHIARVYPDGHAVFFAMPKGSLPHGLAYDLQGRLWVTFEGLSQLARINPDGSIAETVDVRIHAQGAPTPLDTRPHGLGVGADGALWFTGKLSNTVGRVAAGQVSHFTLPTIGAVPIYISQGANGTMWCTELVGNMIARISPKGEVKEFAIPSPASRPIAIIPSPDGKSMWFSEEAGGKVARIDADGKITEFPVPLTQSDAILAGLAFDQDGALWVQQYVSPPAMGDPTANDYIVRLGRELLDAPAGDLSGVPVSYFRAPSKGTVMHRIVQGFDGNMWFTELAANNLGRVTLK
jgi:virginiamycin B lyase